MSPELETAVIAYSLYKLIPVTTTAVKSLRGTNRSSKQATGTSAGADVDPTPSASAGATPKANGHKPSGPVARPMQRVVHVDPATGRFTKADATFTPRATAGRVAGTASPARRNPTRPM